MNPRTPLSVSAVVIALAGTGLLVLYWRNRAWIGAYTPRWARGVLRYSIPVGIVLAFSGASLYLAFVGRFGRWPSPFGPVVLHDVSRAALVVWLVGMASVVLTLVVLLGSAIEDAL